MTWRARIATTAWFAWCVFWGMALGSDQAGATVWHTPTRAEAIILKDNPRLWLVDCDPKGHEHGPDRYRRFDCIGLKGTAWYTFDVYFTTHGLRYTATDQGYVP